MTTRPSGGAVCSSRYLLRRGKNQNQPRLRVWAALINPYNRNAGSYARHWSGPTSLWIPNYLRSGSRGRRNGMSKMVAHITDHVDQCQVAVGKPPLTVNTFKAVVVATGDDRLQRRFVGLLQHRVVTAAIRSACFFVDLDDRIGGHVLGSGCPISVQQDQRLPDPQQLGRIDCLFGADPDAGVPEELRRPVQVASVDAFGVAIEKVGDLGLRQHAVNLARRPPDFRAGRAFAAPKLTWWADSPRRAGSHSLR